MNRDEEAMIDLFGEVSIPEDAGFLFPDGKYTRFDYDHKEMAKDTPDQLLVAEVVNRGDEKLIVLHGFPNPRLDLHSINMLTETNELPYEHLNWLLH